MHKISIQLVFLKINNNHYTVHVTLHKFDLLWSRFTVEASRTWLSFVQDDPNVKSEYPFPFLDNSPSLIQPY